MAFVAESADGRTKYFYLDRHAASEMIGSRRTFGVWVLVTTDDLDTISSGTYFDSYTGKKPEPGDRLNIIEVTDLDDLSTMTASYEVEVIEFDEGEFYASGGDGQFQTTDGQRVQSSRDRASQEVNLSEFTGYDPGGSGATNDTALASAWAAMIARGRSRVVVPPGTYRFTAAAALEKTFVDGTRCELVGAGPNLTQFIGSTSTSANIFDIGDLSGSQTGNIGFRNFSVAPGGASHTGYTFALEKCRNVLFENIQLHLTGNGWGIGPTTVSANDRTLEVTLLNCGGRLQNNVGGSWIHLKGGEFVIVHGGRTTGRASQYFINADGPLNSDGVYVLGHMSEEWGYAIRSVGPGIVNCRIDAHQFDRARHFLYVAGPSGSNNRNWQVRSQFLGEPSYTVTVTIASPGVVTWADHGLEANGRVVFSTTGALPTGITAGTTYFVKTVLDEDTFTISATAGGAVINTSGSQSGVHSAIDGDAAALHFDATDGPIERITIFGSMIDGRKGPAARFIASLAQDRGPYVLFSGNIITDCGEAGTPVFVVGEDANPCFYGNQIYVSVVGAASGYTYGFDYGGASTGRRNDPTDTNMILDFATADVNGTP